MRRWHSVEKKVGMAVVAEQHHIPGTVGLLHSIMALVARHI